MKLNRLTIATALLFCATQSIAIATAPSQITVQGKLTDASGIPLSAGLKTFHFRVFDAAAGGTQVWPAGGMPEIQSITSATDGLWVGLLGAVNPLTSSVFTDTVRWLEIDVDGTTLPRLRLVTGPYAFRVATVDGATGGTITTNLSVGSGHTNTGSGTFVAGLNNSVTGPVATITGGSQNSTDGFAAVIAGGQFNNSTDNYSVISGGQFNTASGGFSIVGAGLGNEATGQYSAVVGGNANAARGLFSFVGGGGGSAGAQKGSGDADSNAALGGYAAIVGGYRNIASGGSSFIGGGTGNLASGYSSVVSGGHSDSATAQYATVAGGERNRASGNWSTVSGGVGNTASGGYATLAGGNLNSVTGSWCAIGGGQSNTASGTYSTVAGGHGNEAIAFDAFVGGGAGNTASELGAAVLGGGGNSATGFYSTVTGGTRNVASGEGSTIGGGGTLAAADSNIASGKCATIPGGSRNRASGTFSFAAGYRAGANHDGAFVWGDSTAADFASTGADQFLIRASGGVGIGTNDPEAPLHILETSAGAVTANTNSILVLERSAGGWISLVSADASQRGILFSEPGSSIAGGIVFDAGSANDLSFRTGGNTTRMTLDASGNLNVTGNITATGTCCASDERFKCIIETLPNALAAVERLRGVSYEWRAGDFPDRNFGDGRQVGLIAQEVREVVPQAVVEQRDGYLAVDYARLVPLLIEGMKEQQRIIEQQNERITRLEHQLEQ